MRSDGIKRILLSALVAFGAGLLAYANPAIGIEHRVTRDEVSARRSFHALIAACPLDWDQAPVARAMLSITQ